MKETEADRVAREILSVQPMDSDLINKLYAASKTEKELIEEGYKPVSNVKLVWIEKDE